MAMMRHLCLRLLPADVALPQGGSLPKTDRQDFDAEQGAVIDALRSVMLAVAELLVPAAAQRTQLLTGKGKIWSRWQAGYMPM